MYVATPAVVIRIQCRRRQCVELCQNTTTGPFATWLGSSHCPENDQHIRCIKSKGCSEATAATSTASTATASTTSDGCLQADCGHRLRLEDFNKARVVSSCATTTAATTSTTTERVRDGSSSSNSCFSTAATAVGSRFGLVWN